MKNEDKIQAIATAYSRWMSGLIISNFKSGGTWFVNGEFKTDDELFAEFLHSKDYKKLKLKSL